MCVCVYLEYMCVCAPWNTIYAEIAAASKEVDKLREYMCVYTLKKADGEIAAASKQVDKLRVCVCVCVYLAYMCLTCKIT